MTMETTLEPTMQGTVMQSMNEEAALRGVLLGTQQPSMPEGAGQGVQGGTLPGLQNVRFEGCATKTSWDVSAESLAQEATFLQKEGREPTNEEILKYIERFRLQEFLADIVMCVAKYMPPDPFEFVQDHLSDLVGRHRTQHDLGLVAGDRGNPKLVGPFTVTVAPPDVSPEAQGKIVRALATMLASDSTARSSAVKRIEQFGTKDEEGLTMTQDNFAKVLDSMHEKIGLQSDDSKLMAAGLQRWRFRANAVKGMQGQPLWPMSEDDFVSAWPSVLRAVRDRYVPIGGQMHRSLFIRKQTGIFEDKYVMGQSLGRGAYGEVMLVTHQSTNQRRVCKRVDRAAQRLSHEQLMAEVELLTKMDHPHVIRLFEFFESEEYLDMIMEPIFGGTLTRLVSGLYCDEAGQLLGKRSEILTETWVAALMTQMLGALSYAHEVIGIIHKDLKTDNVLLVGAPYFTPAEVMKQPVHAMLADFGIAEIFSSGQMQQTGETWQCDFSAGCDSTSGGSYTAPGVWKNTSKRSKVLRSRTVGGTPSYMSPEMFEGSFTEKCDIWSLGVIMFQLLTGDLPYRGGNILGQGNLVCNPRRHPPWDLVSKYKWSLGARWFCQQLLSKQEAGRPSASTAQRDTWLSRVTQEGANVKPARDEVKALQQQHLQSHLMKMARHCVASQLNLSQLHYLNLRFKKYDISGDGRLSHVEMRQALEDVGVATGSDAELIIESLDGDGSGMIEYSEFVAGCLNLAKDGIRDQLRMAFDVFDLDGSGLISQAELCQVLTGGGKNSEGHEQTGAMSVLPDGKTPEEVMRDLDVDGSKQVDYAEFEAYLLKEHAKIGQDLADRATDTPPA
eukprot:CAMPEP_0203907778 /NCGR_PEP_ID=MMETSP0359-20131031/49237_1 /ASSEMBLY_ACC=CAM_ASM_000338 /TAXON_ID=268821 /ORGANISM="Scrippsiella Hangoei, Strain SHTV-5" /LENGTH=839 /DNA_ID=CAMNT_0050832647 /DNA_START=32 /DNA_END=2551 /DNA_ORIENTATION=+